jgi:hypothetical protein
MFQLHSVTPDDWLVWLGGDPHDEAEAIVHEAIVVRGVHRYADVARCIADQLFARDLQRYGPTSDAGFFRRWYVAEAKRLLARLEATRLRRCPPAERA